MRFQCPFCRGIVAVDNSDLGQNVQCGHCSEIVTVPFSRLATGAVIADFIILEELGRGGMGIVYLAHQISLDRPAAVKILAEHYANNAEFVVNFIKEARAAAKLNHPHIVQAYAVGEDEGIFYFAMEHIDGETMKQVLKREKVIPVDQAVTIIQQIAEALDYAWKEARLIHRDIKPDNIMITKNGRAKLADLGLSKVAGEAEDADSDEVMGTPQYISPEHLTGAPMDVRSDIYSLGATFYQLVTGRFPFEGKTPTEIARKHLEEPLTPPQVINPDVPIAVGQVIEKMMAKNIKNRYQDAEQLVEDLRMVRRGKKPPVATQGIKAIGSLSKLGLNVVSATKKQIETQFKTLNMQIGGLMTGKFSTGTVSDLDTLATLELKRQQRKKIIFICAIVLIMVLGLWILSYSFFFPKKAAHIADPVKNAIGNVVAAGNKEVRKRPSASPYIQQIKKIMQFYNTNPDKKQDFLSRVDDFLDDFQKPQTMIEKNELDGLLSVYVPMDETVRVIPARDKLDEKYVKDLEKAELVRQRLLEEAKRQEAVKRQEEEKQRRQEEKLQAEIRKRQEIQEKREEEAARYIAGLKQQQLAWRGEFMDDLINGKFDQAEKILNATPGVLKKLRNDAIQSELNAAESVVQWGKAERVILDKARKMYNLYYNGGSTLAGLTLEMRVGQLAKVENVADGMITLRPIMGGEPETVKIDSLPGKVRMTMIRKAAAALDDDQAEFCYMLSRGYFSAKLKEKAPTPELAAEYSELVKAYLMRLYQKASPEDKKALAERYGQLPEVRELLQQ